MGATLRPQAIGPASSPDEFAVPLCRAHHGAVHRASDEQAWWKAVGIDPLKVARQLWKHTLMNEGRMRTHGMVQIGESDLALNPSDGHNQAPT
jgi:hypothetical protein